MLKKEITFIYMDYAEKEIMVPIAEEAEKRGYFVNLTTNKFAKCEIGIYCQHVNFPQYSKFSVIMLHDIIQQHGNWPDLWMREPWNKYDIGILPSDVWVDNWVQCSKYYYARTRAGVYKVGWPKADKVINLNREKSKSEFNKKYNLDDSKPTILYAPAWENDNKQDDFVKAMLGLEVNIVVKQYPATPDVQPQQYQNILEMYNLHKNNPRVVMLDPKTNIFDAIIVADVLVSEESSTLAESIMLGIPSVAVTDWLIPDVVPSRLPNCNYDFVIKTTKAELAKCISTVISNYTYFKTEARNEREKNFCNIGNSSSMIMDIIDDCVNHKQIRYSALQPISKQHVPLRKFVKHIGIILNREIYYNYAARSKIVAKIWDALRFIKNKISKKSIED